MSGLKLKMLAGFISVAVIAIGTVGIVVSWKQNQSTEQQAELVSSVISVQARQRVGGHLNMFAAFIERVQEDIATKARILKGRPDVTAYAVKYHQRGLARILKSAAGSGDMDFAMIYDLDGNLIASFPLDIQEFRVGDHFNATTLGAGMQRLLDPEGAGDVDALSAFMKVDSALLKAMTLGGKGIDGKGAIAAVSADRVMDDFEDPIGVLISGKLLNHYNEPLVQLNEITGSAFALYLDTTPISSAGFSGAPPSLERDFEDEVMNTGERTVSLQAGGRAFISICSPLGAKGGAAIAVICSSIPESEVTEAKNAMVAFGVETKNIVQFWILTVGVISLILAVLLSLILASGIVGPLAKMTQAMTRLASGEQDFEIPSRDATDEIGQMASAVQVFKDNAIEKQRLEADQATVAGRAEEEKRQTMLDMADQFERQVKEVVDGVSSQATEMQATAQQMSATAEETSRQAGNVASASDQASANVQTVAATAEELSASISEIGRQVMQSAKIAANGVIEAEATNDTVAGLAEAASKIGEVVNLISDIAGQTNLLALNATIEAARAGDAGKGFAVVAQEVKNLANQTAKATEDISKQVAAVQEETTGAVEAIRKITGIIAEISDISTTISSAVEEQGVSTQEIARNVQQAARGTQDVNDNIGSVNKAAGETGAAANQVLTASQEMARQSEGLRGEVDRFLREIRLA